MNLGQETSMVELRRRREERSRPRRAARALPWLMLFASAFALPASAQEGATQRDSDSSEGTITLAVRVHVLHSAEAPERSATIAPDEVRGMFQEVNRIWEAAGIRWDPVSIAEAHIADEDLYVRIVVGAVPHRPALLQQLVPRDGVEKGLDLFFVRELGGGTGGAYLGPITAVLLSEVGAGNVLTPRGEVVRILAHELGHALGLSHVPCSAEGNLMAPRCRLGDARRLSDPQVHLARQRASAGAPSSRP